MEYCAALKEQNEEIHWEDVQENTV